MAPEAQLPVWLYWDSQHIKTTARPWPPKHSTPGILSSRGGRYFPFLLPGTLSLQDINPIVAPVTLSAHLLSDLIVSYNVSDWRQIDVFSPLHRATPVLRHDNSLSFLALLHLVLTGDLFLHCLNDHFIFVYPKSLIYAYILLLFLYRLSSSKVQEKHGRITQGFVLDGVLYSRIILNLLCSRGWHGTRYIPVSSWVLG